jgi:hypothetical protein
MPGLPSEDPPPTGFEPDAKVVVEQVDDTTWEVRQSFSYAAARQSFTIPVGMITDFASVPRIFAWYLPRYGRYTRAAILHDHLWEMAHAGKIDYVDADGTFRQAMLALGVPFLHRWAMWAAVRWAALAKPNGGKGWWREAWRVLLITILALPFLLPPTLVIAVALGMLFVVENAVYVQLKVGQLVKGRERAKPVVRPRIRWKL